MKGANESISPSFHPHSLHFIHVKMRRKRGKGKTFNSSPFTYPLSPLMIHPNKVNVYYLSFFFPLFLHYLRLPSPSLFQSKHCVQVFFRTYGKALWFHFLVPSLGWPSSKFFCDRLNRESAYQIKETKKRKRKREIEREKHKKLQMSCID